MSQTVSCIWFIKQTRNNIHRKISWCVYCWQCIAYYDNSVFTLHITYIHTNFLLPVAVHLWGEIIVWNIWKELGVNSVALLQLDEKNSGIMRKISRVSSKSTARREKVKLIMNDVFVVLLQLFRFLQLTGKAWSEAVIWLKHCCFSHS